MYPNPSRLREIGPFHSTSPVACISLCLITEPKSSNDTNGIFYNNLQPSENPSTLESSLLTDPSVSEFWSVGIYSSPTLTDLTTSKPCTSTIMVPPNLVIPQEVAPLTLLKNLLSGSRVNLAKPGIKESPWEEKTVITFTSAKYVSKRISQR